MRSLVVLLVFATFAGCLSSDEPTPETVAEPAIFRVPSGGNMVESTDVLVAPPKLSVGLQVAADGTSQATIPVEIVLVGYADQIAAELQSRLEDDAAPHSWLRSQQLDGPGGPNLLPAPLVPTATFEVYGTTVDVAIAFRAALTAAEGTEAYDANAAEAWLAETLAAEGLPSRDGVPRLVFVTTGETGHSYRYTYDNGWLEPVRTFGATHDLMVMDLGAAIDPYAGSDRSYMTPQAGDVEIVDSMLDAIEDAVDFRLLQGPIYVPALAPCHAVTLLVAEHATSLSEETGGASADDVDPEALRAAFEELTREEVHVDVKRILLPVDDPGLEAVSRVMTGGFASPASGPAYGIAREWIELNWDTYHVAHEGCEGYLSLLIFADMAQTALGGDWGIALHDVRDGHRFSISVAGDFTRFIYEPGPTEAVLRFLYAPPPESVASYDFANYLLAHETGHLFGMPHPHNHISPDGDFTWAFSAVRTAMSYQMGSRDIQFGLIDQANWDRNRAGFALQDAHASGLLESPEGQAALALMDGLEWKAGTKTLLDARA